MGNSCTSVFPNTRAWEQLERNKIKETEEELKKRGVSIESKAGTKKKKSRLPITSESKYSNNKKLSY